MARFEIWKLQVQYFKSYSEHLTGQLFHGVCLPPVGIFKPIMFTVVHILFCFCHFKWHSCELARCSSKHNDHYKQQHFISKLFILDLVFSSFHGYEYNQTSYQTSLKCGFPVFVTLDRYM